MGHMGHVGQLSDGSRGSWVTKYDPLSALGRGVEGRGTYGRVCPPPHPTMGSGRASYHPAGSGRPKTVFGAF